MTLSVTFARLAVPPVAVSTLALVGTGNVLALGIRITDGAVVVALVDV